MVVRKCAHCCLNLSEFHSWTFMTYWNLCRLQPFFSSQLDVPKTLENMTASMLRMKDIYKWWFNGGRFHRESEKKCFMSTFQALSLHNTIYIPKMVQIQFIHLFRWFEYTRWLAKNPWNECVLVLLMLAALFVTAAANTNKIKRLIERMKETLAEAMVPHKKNWFNGQRKRPLYSI